MEQMEQDINNLVGDTEQVKAVNDGLVEYEITLDDVERKPTKLVMKITNIRETTNKFTGQPQLEIEARNEKFYCKDWFNKYEKPIPENSKLAKFLNRYKRLAVGVEVETIKDETTGYYKILI